MLRMSFLEHLQELRSRIIRAVAGVGVAFIVSLTYTDRLWAFVCQPAVSALKTLGYRPTLVQIEPMESFQIIWVKLPILCSLFLASPWVLYQVWAFISPGLYKRERRWAVPFVVCSAGLFILGGLFAYFVAFRYGLTFLLSIGRGNYVEPMVSIQYYFDLFVNVVLGVGLVFEMPIIIFFLTLIRVVSSGISGSPQPLRYPGYLHHCRGRHAYSGRVQHDVVRHAHVHFVLRGHIRGIPGSFASRA